MANCNYKVNLTDIQNKYKFKIFNTGSYNDSDLRKMIESVFYALPRTTGSGTSVTLTDTAFSYLKNKLGATDTTQDTTTGKNKLYIPNGQYNPNNKTITSVLDSVITTHIDTSASSYGNYVLNDVSISLEAGEYIL